MQALILLTPSESEKAKQEALGLAKGITNSFFGDLLELLPSMTSKMPEKTTISLMPYFLNEIEIQTTTGENTPFLMYSDPERKDTKVFGSRFKMLRLVAGTSFKITGEIIPLSIKDEAGIINTGLLESIFKYEGVTSGEKQLYRQQSAKSLVKYLINIASLNMLQNWAISDKNGGLPRKENKVKIDKTKEKVKFDPMGPETTSSSKPEEVNKNDKVNKPEEEDLRKVYAELPAFTKIRKSMIVIYFREENDDKATVDKNTSEEMKNLIKRVNEINKIEKESTAEKAMDETALIKAKKDYDNVLSEITNIENAMKEDEKNYQNKLLENKKERDKIESPEIRKAEQESVLNKLRELGVSNPETAQTGIGTYDPSKKQEIDSLIKERDEWNKFDSTALTASRSEITNYLTGKGITTAGTITTADAKAANAAAISAGLPEPYDNDILNLIKTREGYDEKISLGGEGMKSKELSKLTKGEEEEKAKLEARKKKYMDRLVVLNEREKNTRKAYTKLEREDIAKNQISDIGEYAKDLLGLSTLGFPVKYMYVPEVEIISYSEDIKLLTPGGKFELILRESSDGEVEIGDALSLSGDLLGKVFNWGKGVFGDSEKVFKEF